MIKTIEAVFDGRLLHPENPLTLKPNTRVRITIEAVEEREREPVSFFKVTESLKLEGPADWATNLETYLYGREDDHEG